MTQPTEVPVMPAMTAKMEDWALYYRDLGYYVFPVFEPDPTSKTGCSCPDDPCTKPGKHPRMEVGHLAGTRSRQNIRNFWHKDPNASIGINCPKSGIVAADIDPRHGGDTSLATLADEFPQTLRAATGGGGEHWIYRADPDAPVTDSTSAIAAGIDVKAQGYIIAAPSRHVSGGQYRWITQGPLPSPDQLPRRPDVLARAPRDSTTGDERKPPLTMPESIPVGARNDVLFRFGAWLKDKALSSAAILDVLAVLNQHYCDEPLTASELRDIQASVERYTPKNPWLENGLSESHAQDGAAYAFLLRSLAESKLRPAPTWLIDGVLVERSLCVVSGEKETLKTFLVGSMALSIATGTPWYGHTVDHARPVVYASGEGSDSITRRFWAWEQEHEAEPIDPAMFRMVDIVPQLLDENNVKLLISDIRAQGIQPAVIVIDTFARAIVGADENSAKDVGRAVAACELLKREFNATIILIHHLSKGGSVRGSTALPAGVDTQIAVTRDGNVLIVECEKQKDFEHFNAHYFESREVILPDVAWFRPGEHTSLVLDATTYDKAAREADSTMYALQALKVLLLAQPDGVTMTQWEQAATAGEHGIGRTIFFEARARLTRTKAVVCLGEPGRKGARWALGEAAEEPAG